MPSSAKPSGCDVSAQFYRTTRRNEDRVAVRAGDTAVTYRDLDGRVDALAERLIELGVESGDRVGVEVRQRPELIVSLLAILRVGGIYVPLDRSYPQSRLEYIIEDCGLRLILGEVRDFDGESLGFSEFPVEAAGPVVPAGVGTEDPAYILYTSGSTGDPKGVVVPHRAILRLVLDSDFLDISAEDRFLQHSPVSFDASTLEIWGALLNGASIVMMPEGDSALRTIGDTIREQNVTIAWMTAGLFHTIAEERIEDFSGLKQLLTGGDVVSPRWAGEVLRAHPELRLINGYGPTENTTFTCCHTITLADSERGEIPIGSPISGTTVKLVEGEIWAGGAGVALGYLNAPELTAECFVDGGKWYRTGDLAHCDEAGVYHFKGRSDQQVKIRGFRVELSEIETAIESHESVRQCVVLAKALEDGADKQLIAFYTGDEVELIAHLEKRLPGYAIPSRYDRVEALPLTPNGKVDRKELAARFEEAPNLAKSVADLGFAGVFAGILGVPDIAVRTNFFDLGFTSLQIARAHARIEQLLKIEFPITDFFQHTTIERLEKHLTGPKVEAAPTKSRRESGGDIAIVGMAGRFPGAPDVDTFWQNLIEGRDTISHFTQEELEIENARDKEGQFVRARGIVEGSDLFDARHFGIPPRDAEQLDPQHRLLLETAQEALENAGHDPDRFAGKIGLFSGSSQNSYLLNNLVRDRQSARDLAAGYPVNDFGVLFGNDKDFIPTRIAYKLNLRGPAIAVQCACSTSLVAITQACDSLRSGTSDMALAGGVSLTFPQKRDYLYTPDGMASADGTCRPFDANATGTVFGEGVGLVALRRLEDAVADGDEVIAVIKGYATNNDGADKAGYAAPSVSGQVSVIREAQVNAGVEARSIGYIEAHGTGTPLGDPIEVAALNEAFSQTTSDRHFCAIGAAKGNVGHLDIAAGVTGLIKTALTLKHGQIPALKHFQKANPAIDFERSAFYPTTELTEWTGETPRRAAVSALGVGGTNAHVILEEAASVATTTPDDRVRFFPLSATSSDALSDAVARLNAFAATQPATPFCDIAATLQIGRREYSHRTTLVARTPEALANAQGASVKASASFEKLAFLFPGQGAQHAGMARDVYENEPIFRAALDRCASILEPMLGLNLIDFIVPAPGTEDERATQLRDTSLAQPAIFSISYALACQWKEWGILPEVLVGHSIGEFAAACFSGVIELEDALHLIARRGRLMADLPGGVMLSVRATEAEVVPLMHPDFDLAAINGPKSCVVAGPHESSESFTATLEAAGLVVKPLHTSHAFHSRMMEPVVDAFEAEVAKVRLSAPKILIFSTVQVDWLSDNDATDPNYWAAHLRQPVRFFDAMSVLWQRSDLGFLEVGPGNTLATLAGQNPDRKKLQPSISSLPHPAKTESSHQYLLESVGRLWSHGFQIDWRRIEGDPDTPRRRVPLPTYPFQRKRFWIEPAAVNEREDMLPVDRESDVVAPLVEIAPVSHADRLTEMLSELSGLSEEEITPDATFLELGLDSLLLTQASKEIKDLFGVAITLRQLIDELPSVAALSKHLEATGSSRTEPPRASTPAAGQLTQAPSSVSTASIPDAKPGIDPRSTIEGILGGSSSKDDDARRGPTGGGPTSAQRKHINDLVARYTARTAKSKAATDQHRFAHADPRTASGFNREWKEMVYQIVTEKSKGSRLLDIDGNEYIDILNGFGPGFLGHSPDFVVEAIEDQLHKGFEVGPNSLVAMEAAELFCEVTGNERASFVNTGSEAVQAAMRLARTVTGRDKIVIFARDYHGNFDEVLVRGVNGKNGLKSLPVAPGIPKASTEQMIVLPYGTDEALTIIKERSHELAAVIVEPVQSRRPEFRPHDFIREVREVTRESGALFVFDEVVTGFRFGPGGAQDFYGVDADLATYGKVVGGGMPVGVVSGKAEFMDTFDGGAWQYGDDSFPEKPVTFFAGTFVRHPLAMAALRAMLQFFKEQPLHFWQSVNAKGDRLAGTVDRFFRDNDIPVRLPNRGSLMFARMGEEQPYGNLMFYHLRERGVFMLEGFPSYLTAAHTDEDIDYVINAFKESAQEMQAAGFFPGKVDAPGRLLAPPAYLAVEAEPPTYRDADAIIEVPTTEAVREIVIASSLSEAASCAFNESASLIFKGEVDRPALARAIDSLVERHDALRATFSTDATTMQIHPQQDIAMIEEDRPLDMVLREEASTAFHLENGPLMRVRYVAGDSTLVLTAHHAVCDGWSFNVIAEELCTLYNATGARIADPKSFAEYALEVTETGDSAYWISQFAELPSAIELPLDRPYPEHRTYAGDTVSHSIDRETYLGIKKFGAQHKSTLYGTLSAVYAALLHRLTGQDEVVYCIPTAGQNDGENTANLVGHCVNFLPLRSRLGSETSIEEFFTASRATMLGAMDHRSYTYGELIRELKIDRDPRRMPLSEVAFNVERMDYFGDWRGLETAFVPNPKTHVHYTMFMNIVESNDGLRIDVDFNTDVLDRATVERWIACYERLMRGLIAKESDRISTLQIAEAETGARSSGRAPDLSVTEYFVEQVLATPTATALRSDVGRWNYAELDDRSRTIAAYLQSQGVGKRDFVAVVSERSMELVAALIGILRAGAAYVPIDPSYPEERQQQILDDAKPKVTLSSFDEALAYSGSFQAVNAAKDDPAYVIYTSGSTGQAKGTVIPHRGITRLVKDTNYIDFSSAQTFLLSAPITFDASTLELWGPLLNGGTLALLPDGMPSLASIGNAIRDHRVTTLWLTAGLFQLMVDERPDDLRPLKQLLAGGDVLSPEHCRRAIDLLEDGALFNGYGPTENTTFTTVHRVTKSDTARASIPIGRPIAHTDVQLLDRLMQPVPMGVRGRLYIGGAGVALGYLNQPEMTAERFIDHAGETLYDSGDDCRLLADGTIEFLGRSDQQVKIRGFRIEPGEIEAVLQTHAAVDLAKVVVAGVGAAEKTLEAYFTGAEVSPAALESYARARLPHYMVPNRIVSVDEMPLTANGKIDSRALRELASEVGVVIGAHHSQPMTSMETYLAGLWSEILGIDEISRDDNFFHLGGHSLAGLKLFTRLQKERGVELPLATLFQAPTIGSLALRVDEISEAVPGLNLLTKIQSGSRNGTPVFLIHGGDGGSLFYKGLVDRTHFDGDVYTLEAPMLIDPMLKAGERSLIETAKLYREQIATVFSGDQCILGGYSFGGAVAYELAQQMTEGGIDVETLLLFDTPNRLRENEFRNNLIERVTTNWQSQSDTGLIGRLAGIGGRLGTGLVSKISHLSRLAELKFCNDEKLAMRDKLRILQIQEDHRQQMNGASIAPYDGPTLLFRAERQSDGFTFNREMGWDGLIEDLTIYDVPGDHQTIFDEPFVEVLAASVDDALSETSKAALSS